MENIRFLKVNKTDLAWLFHNSETAIKRWEKAGLKPKEKGLFLLSDVIKFLKAQHENELQKRPVLKSLDQKHVCTLFGISRMGLLKWRRAGLKQNSKGKYELQTICSFLRGYYQQSAKRAYQERLLAIQKKINRNVKQIERFLNPKLTKKIEVSHSKSFNSTAVGGNNLVSPQG